MLKTMFEKLKIKAVAIKAAVTGAMIAAMTMPVFATTIKPADNVNTLDAIGKFAGTMCDMLRYIGVVVAIWGAAQLAMSFKDDDAGSKHRAILGLVSGALLISIKWLLQLLGLISV